MTIRNVFPYNGIVMAHPTAKVEKMRRIAVSNGLLSYNGLIS